MDFQRSAVSLRTALKARMYPFSQHRYSTFHQNIEEKHILMGMNKTRDMAHAMGATIKSLEAKYDILLEPGTPFVVRLDGCAFKTYTNGFVRPFDVRLAEALIRTMNDLIVQTRPLIGFAQSDEITLIYGGDESISTYPYGGRISKINSVFAGIASARFNYHMSKFDWSDRLKEVQDRVFRQNAHFDARTFSVPDNKTAAEAVLWRHSFDCRRNAIHTIGIHALGHKEIHALSLSEVVETLRVEKDIHVFRDTPKLFLYGTFCKHILRSIPFTHPLTGEKGTVIRGRLENRVFDMKNGPDPQIVSMIVSKYWEPEHPQTVFDIEGLLRKNAAKRSTSSFSDANAKEETVPDS